MSRLKALLSLLIFAVPTLAQTPQDLIDAAPPGSVVDLNLVWADRLRVDKPLTILHGTAYQFDLAGPGIGRVSLIRCFALRIEEDGFSEIYIEGGIFEGQVRSRSAGHVTLIGCTIRNTAGTTWPIPELLITSGDTVLDNVRFEGWPWPDPMFGCFDPITGAWTCSNYSGLVPQARIIGGVGLDLLLAYNTRTFRYGEDLSLLGLTTPNGPPTPDGSLTPGGAVRLSWTIPRPISVIFGQRGIDPTPTKWCLSPRATIVAIGTHTGSYTAKVPATTALLGEVVAFQAYGLHGYNSRPQIAVIR